MGAGYSSLITIGPTLVIIGVITILYLVLDVSKVSFGERELLSATILWVFIFSVMMTAPFNSLFSRYLADKFYQKEYENILPSFYVGLTMVGVISLIMALPVMWSLYYRGGVDLPFILLAYVFWTSAVLIFFTITYLHAIGATYNRIQMYKRIMFRTLSQQMIHVFGIQISITSVLFMVVMLLGRQYFTGMTMEIYPVLAASYLGIFMMYDNIVYLYYFEDRAGALLTAMVYFACTLAGSWWSKELAVQFFGLGAFLGMLAGWTFSFFRIRYVERNIEVLIYCRHKIIDTVRSSAKGKTVYQKAKGWGHRQ